jgi:hypothetical protein
MAPNEMTTGENRDARDPNGWTFDTLYRHLTGLMDEKDKRDEQRFKNGEKNIDTAFVSAENLRAAANEFRGTINDLIGGCIRREEFQQTIRGITASIDTLTSKVDGLLARTAGREEGSQSKADTRDTSFQQWIAVIAVLVSLVAIGVVVFKGSAPPQVVYEPAVPQVPSGAK